MTEHPSARRRTRVARARHSAAPGSRPASAAAPAGSGVPEEARGRHRGAAASTSSESGRSSASTGSSSASTAPRPDGAVAERGRRRAAVPEGSLPRAAGWTVLTSVLPGAGLVPTRMRTLGWLLLAVVVLTIAGLGLWFWLGDPVPTLLGLVTQRDVLIGVLVLVVIVGVVWLLQILAANLAHNARERLAGGRRALSVLLALVLMAGVGMPFAMGAHRVYAAQTLLGDTQVFGGAKDTHDISTGKDPWANIDRINVMLLGQDAGADRTGTRPDTIMVASIDTKTGRTALFSIPRNLQYVRFPEGTPEAEAFPEGFDAFGKDENLINAVWTWADDNTDLFPGDPEPGLTATRHAVEQTLGLKIDYYAMVDLEGFQDLVNAIGGVDFDVERRIPIGGGTNQATGGKYPITGWIEPGKQHLDGYNALWYARSREGSDDNDRMCRQQRMIRTVTEQADPTTLALAFPQLVTATQNNIQTDIPPARIDAFVELAQRVQKGGFESHPLTRDIDAPDSNSWHERGHPDWDYVHQWVQESIDHSMIAVEPPATASPAPAPAAEPTTDAPTSDAPSTEEPTTDAPSTPAPAPAAPADPLAACMPGGQAG
ncbi:LCP family protein [Brachybacterium huguangmaarense]